MVADKDQFSEKPMIDYFAHAAVFEHLKISMKAMPTSDPVVAQKRDHLLDAVSKHGDLALLGSFFDHVVAHAASNGEELALLVARSGIRRELGRGAGLAAL